MLVVADLPCPGGASSRSSAARPRWRAGRRSPRCGRRARPRRCSRRSAGPLRRRRRRGDPAALLPGGARAALLGGVVAGAVALSLYGLATRLFPGASAGPTTPRGLPAGRADRLLERARDPHRDRDPARRGFAAHGGGRVPRARARRPRRPAADALLHRSAAGRSALSSSARSCRRSSTPPATAARARGRRSARRRLSPSCSPRATTRSPRHGDSLDDRPARGPELVKSCSFSALVAAAAAVALHRASAAFSCAPADPLVPRAGSLGGRRALAAAVGRGRRARPTRSAVAGPETTTCSASARPGNGRGDWWRVAATMVADEPLLGTGAGSFEAHWFRERPLAFHARDAHNLYLETLAELGPGRPRAPARDARAAAAALPRRAGTRRARRRRGVRRLPPPCRASTGTGRSPRVTVPAIFCAAVLLAALGRPDGDRSWVTAARASPSRCSLRSLPWRSSPTSATAPRRRASRRRAATSPRAASRGEAGDRVGAVVRGAVAAARRGRARARRRPAARRSLERALDRNPESWSAWFDLAPREPGRGTRAGPRSGGRAQPARARASDELRTKP